VILGDLIEDARELAKTAYGHDDPRTMARAAVTQDSYQITALSRVRSLARRLHIPGVNHALRVVQTAFHGIEINNDVTLGHGVYFVHPLAIVIGGDSRVGNRVRFYGNNTVGTAKDNGYPVIEDDVIIGAGARILGPITVGARSIIGANAVVITDVPPDSVATGVPAVIRAKRREEQFVAV
jgi:serine O-acetyltransferase